MVSFPSVNVEGNLRRSLGLCDMSRDKEKIGSCLKRWWSGSVRLEAWGSLLGGAFEHCTVVTVAQFGKITEQPLTPPLSTELILCHLNQTSMKFVS